MLYGYTEPEKPRTTVEIDLSVVISKKMKATVRRDFTETDLREFVLKEINKIQISDEMGEKCPVFDWKIEDYYETLK